MDSLSQMALGAAVGIAIGGRQHGRKAAAVGAICGTFPDLDVFIDYGSPIDNFTYHRGVSHAFLFHLLATPLLAWVLARFKLPDVSWKDKRLNIMIFAILVTHACLDAMTIYGTQIFWPLPVAPAGVGSLFIIDLLYTLPLLIGIIWFLVNKSWDANKIGLIVSSFYLMFSVSAQNSVRDIALNGVEEKPSHILVQPTPFNTLLWRVLVMTDEGYQVGYYSLFDSDKEIDYTDYPSDKSLLDNISDTWEVQRLQWFTKGFYAVNQKDNKIVIQDLRMGLEPDQYAFQFAVAENKENVITSIPNEQIRGQRDMSRLSKVWDRIWDENVEM